MKAMRSLARRKSTISERLWWFDVVYPITVAILLFGSLTYVVYSGQPSSRLSLGAERKLLEYALARGKNRPVAEPGKTVVVSADPLDVRELGRAPLGNVPEASAVVYARVIEHLVDAGISDVYVRWDPDAHPADEVYYLPLVQTLERLKGHARIRLVSPANSLTTLPPGVGEAAELLDDATCYDPDMLQASCPFGPDIATWVPPQIVLEARGQTEEELTKSRPNWLTTQLPSNTSSFVLNLSNPSELKHERFRDVVSGAAQERLAGFRFAFVGADPSDAISSPGPVPTVRFTRTIYDPSDVDVEVDGTPLQVFWAQLAQMALDDAFVAVPPVWASVAATAAFCLFVIVAMFLFGGPTAAGIFVVVAASSPWVNGFAIKHLGVYLPMFDTLYFGLSTFIFAGFGRLSYTAFHRWRLDEQRRMHALTADLKGNFISLLSHNLNTPVAKMQGMLSLLSMQAGEAPWKDDALRAERYVAQLEYAIRSVLTASALEEGSTAETARSAKFLSDEFGKTMVPSLRRLGVRCAVGELKTEAGSEDLLYTPLDFDVRVLHGAVAALTALFAQEGRMVGVTVGFAVEVEEEASHRPYLVVTLAAKDASPPDSATAILVHGMRRSIRNLGGQSFYTDVLAGLAVLVARTYQGRIEVATDESGARVTATFHPRTGDDEGRVSTTWH